MLQGPTAMQALIDYSSLWTALQQLISLQLLESLREELSTQHLEGFGSNHKPSAPVAATSSTTYCNPHVVSGACQLLHNLLLSFPEIIVAGLHSSGLIKTMAR